MIYESCGEIHGNPSIRIPKVAVRTFDSPAGYYPAIKGLYCESIERIGMSLSLDIGFPAQPLIRVGASDWLHLLVGGLCQRPDD